MLRLRVADATMREWNAVRCVAGIIATTIAKSPKGTDVLTVWRMLPSIRTGTIIISFLAEAAL